MLKPLALGYTRRLFLIRRSRENDRQRPPMPKDPRPPPRHARDTHRLPVYQRQNVQHGRHVRMIMTTGFLQVFQGLFAKRYGHFVTSLRGVLNDLKKPKTKISNPKILAPGSIPSCAKSSDVPGSRIQRSPMQPWNEPVLASGIHRHHLHHHRRDRSRDLAMNATILSYLLVSLRFPARNRFFVIDIPA